MTSKEQKNLKDFPEWAKDLTLKLKQVEIYLGNIPSALAWKSDHLKDINKRSFNKDESVFDEEKSEFIYKRIVRGLSQENYSPDSIALFLNTLIGYEGAPPYTSKEEVLEALG